MKLESLLNEVVEWDVEILGLGDVIVMAPSEIDARVRVAKRLKKGKDGVYCKILSFDLRSYVDDLLPYFSCRGCLSKMFWDKQSASISYLLFQCPVFISNTVWDYSFVSNMVASTQTKN